MTKSENAMFDVNVDDKVPVGKATFLGIQHILGMTGMFVLPGILGRALHLPVDEIAYLYAVTFITAGIATILQAVFLLRLPIIQSTFAGNFAAIISVAHIAGPNGLAVAYGSLLIASLIWLAIFALTFGGKTLSTVIKHFDLPLYRGMLIILVMLQLMNVAFPNWIATPATPGFPFITSISGLITVLIIIFCAARGGTFTKSLGILFAIMCGTLFYALFEPISLQPVLDAPLLTTLKPLPFGFEVKTEYVIIFLVTQIPSFIASVSMYGVVSRWTQRDLTAKSVSGGLLGISLASIFASVFGGFTTIVYPDNIGILKSTRIASRFTTLSAGLLLIVLGFFAKAGMLFVIAPLPVLAAAATILFGIIIVHGIELMAEVKWDQLNLMIAGLAITVALGGLFISQPALDQMPLLVRLIIKQPIISGGLILLCGSPLRWLLNKTPTLV